MTTRFLDGAIFGMGLAVALMAALMNVPVGATLGLAGAGCAWLTSFGRRRQGVEA